MASLRRFSRSHLGDKLYFRSRKINCRRSYVKPFADVGDDDVGQGGFPKKDVVYALFELVLLYAQTARGISLRIEVYKKNLLTQLSQSGAQVDLIVVDFPTPPF